MTPADAPLDKNPVDVRLMGATVRVPDHVVYRSFPAETVVLDLDTGTYQGLNHTGGRMLEALDRLGAVKRVAAELAEEFQQPVPRIQFDLCRFCQELLGRGLIELVAARP
jgi:Coenzyme PQQ synthesis protein D (PqqD)